MEKKKKLVVWVSPRMHRDLVLAAALQEKSRGSLIREALRRELQNLRRRRGGAVGGGGLNGEARGDPS